MKHETRLNKLLGQVVLVSLGSPYLHFDIKGTLSGPAVHQRYYVGNSIYNQVGFNLEAIECISRIDGETTIWLEINAAKILRKIPSKARKLASQINGKKGGRPNKIVK